jgi:hypothetical protein
MKNEKYLAELRDSVKNLEYFVAEITKNEKYSLVKPLSVELRKLLYEGGRNNNLLGRLEKDLKIKIKFPCRTKSLPHKTIDCNIEDYRKEFIFKVSGRSFNRIDLIKMVANEKGAHIDDNEDPLHEISKKIFLPLGNPARGGSILDQNTMYLVSIAKITIRVIRNSILK